MEIGGVKINSQLALAPMAGVTDAAFRQICSELGAGLTYTELVSAKALCYQDKKSRQLLRPFPGERPFAAQIFGSDIPCMAEAAQIAIEASGADLLDINMGCPVGKVVSSGDGAALMKDPEKAARLAEAVVKSSPVPVTVKMRRGWDKGSINAVPLSRMLEEAAGAYPPLPSMAAPGCRCTAARRTGPPSGRSKRRCPSRSSPTETCFPARTRCAF